MITRGFTGRRPRAEIADRLPPGQHETTEFPVLSIGPSPLADPDWSLTLSNRGKQVRLNWGQFQALPQATMKTDIHCVTRWSKFDTMWQGVLLDSLLAHFGFSQLPAFVSAISADGYSSNLQTKDLLDGRAMVATHFGEEPLSRHHGGPARLLVPKLYFWKSAKWLTEINFVDVETPGFWETRGYHHYGDPWREQRFDGE